MIKLHQAIKQGYPYQQIEVYQEIDPLRIELKTNYRQKDKVFMDILNNAFQL